MRCPYCGHDDSRVTDSRDTEEGIRRRRECQRCGLRFTTSERVQTTSLLVVKRDGRREGFHRDKVRTGALYACAKRPVPIEAIERLCDDVERELGRLGRAEVPSSLIGQMVMERLQALDHVSYVRFASVYRNFQDLESFQREVEALLEAGADHKGGGHRPAPPEAQLSLPLAGEAGDSSRDAGHPTPKAAAAPGAAARRARPAAHPSKPG